MLLWERTRRAGFPARREAMVVVLNYKDEREASLHWLRRYTLDADAVARATTEATT